MALQDLVRNLGHNPTLGELEPEALRLIAFSAETRVLRSGDVLFNMGDTSDGGYLVLSGGIALESGLAAPMVVRPPALIGDTALIVETSRPCTALAREPSSVMKISQTLFQRVLTEFPGSAVRLRRRLVARLMTLRDDLEELHRELG